MNDLRSGIDRRTEDRGTPERRSPGRPPLPADQQPMTRHVKLPADVDDALCRAAVRLNMKVNMFIRKAIERAILAGDF